MKDFLRRIFDINTEEDLLISHNQNPESGEPFFGSWTDDPELFRKDKNVQILVVEYSLYFPLLLSILDYFIKSNFRRNDH